MSRTITSLLMLQWLVLWKAQVEAENLKTMVERKRAKKNPRGKVRSQTQEARQIALVAVKRLHHHKSRG
jgi:hypothetical protein